MRKSARQTNLNSVSYMRTSPTDLSQKYLPEWVMRTEEEWRTDALWLCISSKLSSALNFLSPSIPPVPELCFKGRILVQLCPSSSTLKFSHPTVVNGAERLCRY
jgi:hypothetical protein